jgi:ubiquinone biosynthesis protein COQ4
MIQTSEVTRGIISLLKDPSATDSVYDIEDGLKDSWFQQFSLRFIKSDQQTAQAIEERYIPEKPNLETLLQLPVDSLGYQYASHLISHGFDPNFYRAIDVHSEVDYLLLRQRQTHDIWHIITGFGIDPMGEIQLKAFEWSQSRRPMALVLVLGGFFATLIKSPRSLTTFCQRIIDAYHLGKTAKPLLSCRWEKEWSRTIADWRNELGI